MRPHASSMLLGAILAMAVMLLAPDIAHGIEAALHSMLGQQAASAVFASFAQQFGVDWRASRGDTAGKRDEFDENQDQSWDQAMSAAAEGDAAHTFDFAMVTDKDHNSVGPEKGSWHSILRHGSLRLDPLSGMYSIAWGNDTVLSTRTATKGRGMELSELVQYRHLLFAFCDTTGIVWKVQPSTGRVLQRYAIADGDGEQPKPFKSEWATVKDGLLWVGSVGRPYTLEDGTILNHDGEWVKTVDPNGRIENINWTRHYEALRAAAGTSGEGYLWHEAVHWDAVNRRWLFLPRKRSFTERYDEVANERRGTNVLLIASEDFADIQRVEPFGPAEEDYGFTSLRLVPGTQDVVMATKVLEHSDKVHSKLNVFTLQGESVLEGGWQDLGPMKFEGLEFLTGPSGGEAAA